MCLSYGVDRWMVSTGSCVQLCSWLRDMGGISSFQPYRPVMKWRWNLAGKSEHLSWSSSLGQARVTHLPFFAVAFLVPERLTLALVPVDSVKHQTSWLHSLVASGSVSSNAPYWILLKQWFWICKMVSSNGDNSFQRWLLAPLSIRLEDRTHF